MTRCYQPQALAFGDLIDLCGYIALRDGPERAIGLVAGLPALLSSILPRVYVSVSKTVLGSSDCRTMLPNVPRLSGS